MFKRINWWIIVGALVFMAGILNLSLEYKGYAPSPLDRVYDPGVNTGLDPIVEYVVTGEAGVDSPKTLAPTITNKGSTPVATQVSWIEPTQATPAPDVIVPIPIHGLIPERLVIPEISLDAPIFPVHYKDINYKDQVYRQWRVPDVSAAGWQDTSALIGVPGNTVLNGHHNAYGMVFENLVELKEGDVIQVFSGQWEFRYKVVAKMLLPERYQSLDVRMDNARWIQPSGDERLTLITCWPAESNTHRVIIVAYPDGDTIHHPEIP